VSRKPNIDHVFKIIETNLGNWQPEGLAIVDFNFKVWGVRGDVPEDVLNFYRRFSLSEMHVGDTVHNNNTFMMKATDKIGVIVVMKNTHLSMLSAINLKGRINALSDLYELEKKIKTDGEEPEDGETYLRSAEIFLKEEAYEIASDFITLAGFHYLLHDQPEKAKEQAERALKLCKEKGITSYHLTFALSCNEACNQNLEKAEEFWNQVRDKYSEQEKTLVDEAIKKAKKMKSLLHRFLK